MKHSRLLAIIGGLALVAPVMQAQNTSPQELPSAPSAVKQQQQMPKPAPAPPPQQQTPVTTPAKDPVAPATNSGTPSQPSNSAPASTAASTLPPAPPEDPDSQYVFKADVSEVNVIFTVTDKHGRFVKDLKQNDFKILDDNKAPKQVDYFRAETDLPLRVGLLIDASNSVRDRFTFEQESAIEFLNQMIRPKFDRAFVIGFDTTAEVTQDFTDDTEKLSRGVRGLRAGGGTAMYDALYWACRDKLMKEEVKGPARRAIILLSDGEDNQSRVTREEAIEMAQRAEVIVYAISTNVSGIKMRGDKVLERMAEATGGRAFFPFKVQDVANAFTEIQDELRSQYALAYKPDDFKADGRYRTIDIAAIGRDKNLRVRARKGYFAPKQ